jgi:CYTH domain-containing protein
LSKVRYDVPWKKHTIEIDVYRGRHDGLVVAEVEFDDLKSCANFQAPNWLGRDVTGNRKYSNVALALDGGAR